MDIRIEIPTSYRIEIGLSGEVKELVRGLANGINVANEDTGPEAATSAAPEPAPSAAPEAAPSAAPEAAPSAAASAAEISDEDMRTLIDIEISRLTGTPEWKESQDSRVIALRRSASQCFMEVSNRLGAPKPTALRGEKRTEFLERIKEIAVNGDRCEVLPF